MKKVVLICTLLLSINCFSQNGGQVNENPSVKMEYISLVNGVTTLKITNKQNCIADIQTKTSIYETSKSYQPLSSDTVKIVGLSGTNVKIQSKALTNCSTTDYGQAELTLNINALPVKFGRIETILSIENKN